MTDSQSASNVELTPSTAAASAQGIADPLARAATQASSTLASLNALQPKSTFWAARKLELQLQAVSAAKLEDLNNHVEDVGDKVATLQFPTALNVTAALGTDDHALLQQSTDAIKEIATVAQAAQGGECGRLARVSNLGFFVIARLTTLAAHLMDLHHVSAQTVLDKLTDDDELIGEIKGLLAQLPPAAAIFDSVVDPRFFADLVHAGDDDSPTVFDELNRRAAHLVAVKCLVATRIGEGDTQGHWPPPPDDPPADPIGKSTRAARKKAAGR